MNKQTSKQGTTATATIMDEHREPVGKDKETAVRGAQNGVTVTAKFLAGTVAESKAELQASAKRADKVMELLTTGTKDSITEALRPAKPEDGNRYAISMPVLAKGTGKQAHGADGKPLFELKAQPPMVYFLVTENGMELQSARVRVREVRAIRAALNSGEPFEWHDEDGHAIGWGALVRLADKVNKIRQNKDRAAAAKSRVDAEFRRMQQENEIPSLAEMEPEHLAKVKELYKQAEAEVAADEAAKAAQSRADDVKKAAARIVKDKGYDEAQEIAKAILAMPRPEPEQQQQGEPSVELKEAVAGALTTKGKGKNKAAKVAVH